MWDQWESMYMGIIYKGNKKKPHWAPECFYIKLKYNGTLYTQKRLKFKIKISLKSNKI